MEQHHRYDPRSANYQLRREIEQMRRETRIRRLPISAAAQELCRFVGEHQREDVLVNGFQSDRQNPYRPKSNMTCALL